MWRTGMSARGDMPRLVHDFRTVTITPGTGERLVMHARRYLGQRGRFDVLIRPGWCWMQSRFLLRGVAAAPTPRAPGAERDERRQALRRVDPHSQVDHHQVGIGRQVGCCPVRCMRHRSAIHAHRAATQPGLPQDVDRIGRAWRISGGYVRARRGPAAVADRDRKRWPAEFLIDSAFEECQCKCREPGANHSLRTP